MIKLSQDSVNIFNSQISTFVLTQLMSNRYSNSRERSRQRYHGYRGRSESSEDSYEKRKKADRSERRGHNYKAIVEPPQPKRVNRFSETHEIKLFRKEDEPCSKGLTEAELQQFKKKMETEVSGNYGSMNWDNIKHYEAQLQQNSIKQEKEREKALNEKLMGVKEDMIYYAPIAIHIRPKETKSAIAQGPEGSLSLERQALTTRLNDVLGCFYVHESQTPADPSFQIQNTSTSTQPKNISFDKLIVHNSLKEKNTKDQKPLKGILKSAATSGSNDAEPRKIDPKLIAIIRQINSQNAKNKYSKEQIETLLAPFKATGQLAYVFANKEILSSILSTPPPPANISPPAIAPAPVMTAPTPYQPYQQPHNPEQPRMGSVSHERDSLTRNNPPNYYGNPPEKYYHNSTSPLEQKTQPPNQNFTQYNRPYVGQQDYGSTQHHTGSQGRQYGSTQQYGNRQQYGRPQNEVHPPYGQQPQYGQPYVNQPYAQSYGQPSPYGYPPQNYPNVSGNKGGPDYKYPGPTIHSQPPTYLPPGPQAPLGGSMYPQPPGISRNYKTVPCKYFHSSQGCVKADSCTFIHEEQYAGRPTPGMLKSNRGMVMQSHGMQNEGMGGYHYSAPQNQ